MSNKFQKAAVAALIAPVAFFSVMAESATAAVFKLEEATINSINEAFRRRKAKTQVEIMLNELAAETAPVNIVLEPLNRFELSCSVAAQPNLFSPNLFSPNLFRLSTASGLSRLTKALGQ